MKQSTEHTYECIAPETGALLMQYELGNLSDTEREHFERHLLDCDFCLAEVASMHDVADALIANRKSITEAYNKEGVTVSTLLVQASDRPKLQPIRRDARQTKKASVFSWDSLFGPRAAIAFAAAAAIVLIVGLNVFTGDKPIAVGMYTPPSWLAWQTRGTESTDSLLISAQQSYSAMDFASAASKLGQYLKDHEDAQATLYLGVSQYELGRLDLARQSLMKVSTSNSVIRSEADFYRALIMIRQGDNDEAVAILKQLAANNSNRVEEARELMKQLGENSE